MTIKEVLVKEYHLNQKKYETDQDKMLRVGKGLDGAWFDFIEEGVHTEFIFSEQEFETLVNDLVKIRDTKLMSAMVE